MKKNISTILILLAFIMTVGCLCSFTKTKALADQIDYNFSIQSKSAYLIDANSNSVIYSKNENEKLPIASMNKIMTLLLCFFVLLFSDRSETAWL